MSKEPEKISSKVIVIDTEPAGVLVSKQLLSQGATRFESVFQPHQKRRAFFAGYSKWVKTLSQRVTAPLHRVKVHLSKFTLIVRKKCTNFVKWMRRMN